MHFPVARARSGPFSSSRARGNSFFAKLTQLNGNDSISAPKIGKWIKFLTLGAKIDIFAPMAPTPINVMVSLLFWDHFYSFSDFGANFHYFGVKITFRSKKPQSRPKRPESVSWNFHFRTRKKLEGFFATEECKFWSFFALSARNESYLGF